MSAWENESEKQKKKRKPHGQARRAHPLSAIAARQICALLSSLDPPPGGRPPWICRRYVRLSWIRRRGAWLPSICRRGTRLPSIHRQGERLS